MPFFSKSLGGTTIIFTLFSPKVGVPCHPSNYGPVMESKYIFSPDVTFRMAGILIPPLAKKNGQSGLKCQKLHFQVIFSPQNPVFYNWYLLILEESI